MWNLNVLCLKEESNVVSHRPKPEWQGAGRNHRLSVPSVWSWKVAPVKQHVGFQDLHFQNFHRHTSSKSNRSHQCTEELATDEGLWMYWFTKGAARLRKLIEPCEGRKHQDKEKFFAKCGAIQWIRKPCSIPGPTQQCNFSASYT